MAGLDKDGLEYFGEQAAHSGLLPENFWSGCLHVTRGRRDLISSFYSEIRLGPRVAHADLLYSLKSNSFASWLQAMHADGETGPSRRLLELILAKYNQTTSLWFEHDNVAQATMAHRQPSLCVCLVPGYHGERVPAASSDADIELICGLIDGLTGTFSEQQARRIRRVVGCLPKPGRFIHLSFMAGREPQVIKLYGTVPREALVDYLREIGWDGPMLDIASVIEQQCPRSRVGDDIYLDLTLDTLTTPGGNRLGFAFTPQHIEHSSERDAGRKPLLDQWVDAGLCSAWQRDQLVQWPARIVMGGPRDEAWPLCFVRWLDCKCVWDPGLGLSAKAYLGFAARRLSPFESSR